MTTPEPEPDPDAMIYVSERDPEKSEPRAHTYSTVEMTRRRDSGEIEWD